MTMWKAWAGNSEPVRGLALKEVMGALDQLPEMSLLPPPKGSWWVRKQGPRFWTAGGDKGHNCPTTCGHAGTTQIWRDGGEKGRGDNVFCGGFPMS